jgi:2-polyprenyl-3-methyl-5-hydroxy-6-metoxy-1,4-benzoquinol methylase
MTYDYTNLKTAPNRDTLICALSQNKRVLHIGATDAPFTKEKYSTGLLLHKHLQQSAASVHGIDIEQDAIDYLKTVGIDDISYFDMNQLGQLNFDPDIIVFGEIIEHLQNLQTALTTIKSVMTSTTELLISTPNLLYVLPFLTALLRKKEELHPDHKTGFTYGLLKQLLEANGLELCDFYFTFLPRTEENLNKKIIRGICKVRPGVCETLLAVAKLKS